MSTARDTPTNQLKEQMLDMVRQNFIQDGEIVPVAMLTYPDGEGEVIATEFRDDKSKIAFANFLRKRCRVKQPIAIMLVSEAHMLIVSKERAEELRDSTDSEPLEGEEETDVIVCAFETKLISEVIIMEVISVGGKHIIVREVRKGKYTDGIFKDILATPVGLN